MEKIEVPKELKLEGNNITKEQIRNYFEEGYKCPTIKEELILKAYEITEKTKILYDIEEVSLLYSQDQTGTYLSCFNKIDEQIEVKIPLKNMGLEEAEYKAYCVLTDEELSVMNQMITLQIPVKGVLLVKIFKDS